MGAIPGSPLLSRHPPPHRALPSDAAYDPLERGRPEPRSWTVLSEGAAAGAPLLPPYGALLNATDPGKTLWAVQPTPVPLGRLDELE